MAGWGVQGLHSDPRPLARRITCECLPTPTMCHTDPCLGHVSPVQRDPGVRNTAIKIGLNFLPESPAEHDVTWPHPSRPWGPHAAGLWSWLPGAVAAPSMGRVHTVPPCVHPTRTCFGEQRACVLLTPPPFHFYFSNPIPVPARLSLHRRETETQEGEPTAWRTRNWLFSWLSPILRSKTFTERVKLTPTNIPPWAAL